MYPEKELSDLKLTRNECSKCGAIWINGKHIWSGTGASSEGTQSELDLAGLICNTSYGGGDLCINPQKGKLGGQTWKDRVSSYEEESKSLDETLKQYKNESGI